MTQNIRITLAEAMGTCFGVQDAIDMALDTKFRNALTVVGQLVHNPQTVERLKANGVALIDRDQIDEIKTKAVMITAHGASDQVKEDLRRRGHQLYDASCPLVIRLHNLARFLEKKGYFPVIVGQEKHVEVQGVVGNLKDYAVVNSVDDVSQLAGHKRIGVVSQTTNRLSHVENIVEAMRALPDCEDFRFIDTICKPVKERQQAIHSLLAENIDLGIVIGGFNSANTRKLADMMSDRGIEAHHIERASDLDRSWFVGKHHVGITAGTSTPQDVIESVYQAVRSIAADKVA